MAELFVQRRLPDHIRSDSLGIFIAGLVEFLLRPAFATLAFFFILLITLVDVVASFTVTIASTRRDIAMVNGLRL